MLKQLVDSSNKIELTLPHMSEKLGLYSTNVYNNNSVFYACDTDTLSLNSPINRTMSNIIWSQSRFGETYLSNYILNNINNFFYNS